MRFPLRLIVFLPLRFLHKKWFCDFKEQKPKTTHRPESLESRKADMFAKFNWEAKSSFTGVRARLYRIHGWTRSPNPGHQQVLCHRFEYLCFDARETESQAPWISPREVSRSNPRAFGCNLWLRQRARRTPKIVSVRPSGNYF